MHLFKNDCAIPFQLCIKKTTRVSQSSMSQRFFKNRLTNKMRKDMKKFAATLCIIGTALVLSACETSTSYDSGSNYATGRTAGDVDTTAPVVQERVFREIQTK